MAKPSLKFLGRKFSQTPQPTTLVEQIAWQPSERRIDTATPNFTSRINIPRILWCIMFFLVTTNQTASALADLTTVIEFFSQRAC